MQYTVERLHAAVRSLEGQATRDYLTGAYNRGPPKSVSLLTSKGSGAREGRSP